MMSIDEHLLGMRVLFLTNFYPPASRGGYEQWCQEIAEGLRAKGHEVFILTSRHGENSLSESEPVWIHRDLYLEMELTSLRNAVQFFTHRKSRERVNLAQLRQAIKDFSPDAVLVWGMWNLPRSLPALAEELMPDRIAYYMGDYWPTLPSQFQYYWQEPARHWSSAVIKKMLGAIALRVLASEKLPPLKLERVIFPSVFIRNEFNRRGVRFQSSEIIYGAVDTHPYLAIERSYARRVDEELVLLFVGRLTHEKGVHVAIQALGDLVHRRGYKNVKLSIAGTGDADYEKYLRDLVEKENVRPYVVFLGAVAKEAMPALYAQSDVLLFTSIWDEPFGRVIVEAMASGMMIIGSITGGAAEILIDDENSLTCVPNDAGGLANQIARLIESPELQHRLAECGRKQAREKFDIYRMTVEIDTFLQSLAGYR